MSSFNNDRLMETLSVLNATRSFEKDEAQAKQQQVENNLQATRLDLEASRIASDQSARKFQMDLERTKQWDTAKANAAASESAVGLAQIDKTAPDAERSLANWVSYAQANGVQGQQFEQVFGDHLKYFDEKHKNEQLLASQQKAQVFEARVKELDGDALELHQTLTDAGMEPSRAFHIAKKSADAKATFNWYVDYMHKNGMPIPAYKVEDLTTTGDSQQGLDDNAKYGVDTRPVFWSAEKVQRWVNTSVLTPELTKKLNDDAKFEEDKRKADLNHTQALTGKANAETTAIQQGKLDVSPSRYFLKNGQPEPEFKSSF
jgi:hypothetical protein